MLKHENHQELQTAGIKKANLGRLGRRSLSKCQKREKLELASLLKEKNFWELACFAAGVYGIIIRSSSTELSAQNCLSDTYLMLLVLM